jgi:hypothetical protein
VAQLIAVPTRLESGVERTCNVDRRRCHAVDLVSRRA